jgi:hypothetical protein
MLKRINDPSHSILRLMLLTLIAEQQLRTGRFADAIRALDRRQAARSLLAQLS